MPPDPRQIADLRKRRPDLFETPRPPTDPEAEARHLAEVARLRQIHSHPGIQAFLTRLADLRVKADAEMGRLREQALPTRPSVGGRLVTPDEYLVLRDQVAEVRGFLHCLAEVARIIPPAEGAEAEATEVASGAGS